MELISLAHMSKLQTQLIVKQIIPTALTKISLLFGNSAAFSFSKPQISIINLYKYLHQPVLNSPSYWAVITSQNKMNVHESCKPYNFCLTYCTNSRMYSQWLSEYYSRITINVSSNDSVTYDRWISSFETLRDRTPSTVKPRFPRHLLHSVHKLTLAGIT